MNKRVLLAALAVSLGCAGAPAVAAAAYTKIFAFGDSLSDAGNLILDALNAPEPSTWAIMLAGFAGLGFAGFIASRRAAAT